MGNVLDARECSKVGGDADDWTLELLFDPNDSVLLLDEFNISKAGTFEYGITDQKQRRRVYKAIQKLVANDKIMLKQSGIMERIDSLKMELQNKSTSELQTECSNMECDGIGDLSTAQQSGQSIALNDVQCAPLRRIHLIMEIYNKLLLQSTDVSVAAIIHRAEYGHQQLIDDFLHFQRARSLAQRTRR